MLNKEKEIQKILRGKFMEGPKLLLDEDSIGINYFSGNLNSAYYELYGNSSIFRLIIIEPSTNLFTNQYVGKNHLLFLLLEEEQVRGGFVSLNVENLVDEFGKVFSYLREEQIEELHGLWRNFASLHYMKLTKE
ncbi:hypothetical protein H9649_15380 [Sporosarcina sp. Sa2YVA2]|uniref:Uncharacterized protein n=1 Tax=Sporosarcina quadrami TaxID=2762234 RepID=A0ABR8UD42_9BACL|nr:hypothetical protein [Sporosarcina quadrami]MBD7985953.1 hypothetical protein [Sporosarcina quadrami]